MHLPAANNIIVHAITHPLPAIYNRDEARPAKEKAPINTLGRVAALLILLVFAIYALTEMMKYQDFNFRWMRKWAEKWNDSKWDSWQPMIKSVETQSSSVEAKTAKGNNRDSTATGSGASVVNSIGIIGGGDPRLGLDEKEMSKPPEVQEELNATAERRHLSRKRDEWRSGSPGTPPRVLGRVPRDEYDI